MEAVRTVCLSPGAPVLLLSRAPWCLPGSGGAGRGSLVISLSSPEGTVRAAVLG